MLAWYILQVLYFGFLCPSSFLYRGFLLPPIHYGDRTAVDNWRLSPKGGSRWSAALWRKRKGWQQMVHWQCSTVQKRQVSDWFPGVSWATITQRRFQLILPSLLQLIRFIHFSSVIPSYCWPGPLRKGKGGSRWCTVQKSKVSDWFPKLLKTIPDCPIL